MKFKGKPNELCRITKIPRFVKCPNKIRFDEKGIFETENKYLIKRLSIKFETLEDTEELNEEKIRQLAKEKGIKSWHVKSIERLLQELEE